METDEEGFVTGFEVPEGQFVVWGVAYANPGKADELEAVYSQTMRNALTEPGCLHYCICRERDSDRFHFFERYTGKASFEAHNEHPIIKSIFAKDLMRGCKDVVFALPSSLYDLNDDPAIETGFGKNDNNANEHPPLPNEEVGLYGSVDAHPKHAEVLAQVFSQSIEFSRSQPEVLYYCVCRDPDSATKFHLFERYTSCKALKEHRRRLLEERLATVGYGKFVYVTLKPVAMATQGASLSEDGQITIVDAPSL